MSGFEILALVVTNALDDPRTIEIITRTNFETALPSAEDRAQRLARLAERLV